ncbi:hypothetical protein PENNAL_c0909G09630, partial [Penicillium nalgiovense]
GVRYCGDQFFDCLVNVVGVTKGTIGPRLRSEYFQPLILIGLPLVRGRPRGRFGALDVEFGQD